MKIGDPSDESTQLGALISADHLAKVESYVNWLRRRRRDTHRRISLSSKEFEHGNWLAPTVISGLATDARCTTEEILDLL